jgi:hypothetical protein
MNNMDLSKKTERLIRYTGNVSQLFYAQPLRLCGGRADGLEAVDVDNGAGMRLLVLPGHGMDIGRLSFNGMNVSFLSKGGFAHSAHYNAAGMAGLETFAGGFLTTCGLRNSGLPNECENESFGMHGRIGQTAATDVSINRNLFAERPVITLTGIVREGWLFSSSLELHRTISIYYDEPAIYLNDIIYNLTPRSEGILLLYHFNLGYPLLDENARFITSHHYEKPVDKNAEAGQDKRYEFSKPIDGEPEQCFYYKQAAAEDGRAFAACINEKKGMGVAVFSDPAQLPLLCNWKSCASGDYVMGIEPCTCYGDGREAHRLRGQLDSIPAYGEKHVSLRVEVLNAQGIDRLKRLAAEI